MSKDPGGTSRYLDRITDLEVQLGQTLQEIERLEARVAELEGALQAILDVPPDWGDEVYEIETIASLALVGAK